ncbi:transposase [Desulfosporosinus acidiphilus]|uniref:transposase n=1 Tax=Desulfosporosinus acidiphilus TaxID=885581 RepID=UPI001930DC2B|nr:transposase [Desulfosporosinus acidiphilus]
MGWTLLKFSRAAQSTVFQEYLHHLDEIEQRIKRLEAEIHDQATDSVHAPMIQALQTLRGVAELSATSLVAEIGSFTRFGSARRIMSYTGLVPSERSTGETRHQGKMTKTGNAHVRRILIEAAWSYRYTPAIKGEIRKRQQGKPPEITMIAWKAQDRLHRKYKRLMGRGKPSGKVIAAVARELAGFVWAIACEVKKAS